MMSQPAGSQRGALDISWYPAEGENVNSYRILRSDDPDGPFELIGESMTASFTDTLVKPGQTACYRVQSYNGAAHLSAQSAVLCNQDDSGLFLPVIIR